MVPVAREVKMVKPNLGGGLNTNGIACFSKDLGDLDIPDDNVLLVQDAKSNANQSFERVSARSKHT